MFCGYLRSIADQIEDKPELLEQVFFTKTENQMLQKRKIRKPQGTPKPKNRGLLAQK